MIESVADLQQKFESPKNANEEHQRRLSKVDKIAVYITDITGSMSFFFVLLVITISWVCWNLFAPHYLTFDPFPAFVVLLLITNLIQLHLMPLIMVSQNLQGRHAELRAEQDYRTNKKAELEVETILLHLEAINKRLDKLEGRHKP